MEAVESPGWKQTADRFCPLWDTDYMTDLVGDRRVARPRPQELLDRPTTWLLGFGSQQRRVWRHEPV